MVFVHDGRARRDLAQIADDRVGLASGAAAATCLRCAFGEELAFGQHADCGFGQREAVREMKQLMREAVPLLEGLIEADAEAGRAQDRRVRIGLYSYAADMRPPQKQEESEK